MVLADGSTPPQARDKRRRSCRPPVRCHRDGGTRQVDVAGGEAEGGRSKIRRRVRGRRGAFGGSPIGADGTGSSERSSSRGLRGRCSSHGTGGGHTTPVLHAPDVVPHFATEAVGDDLILGAVDGDMAVDDADDG